jgi:hypothetical protein
MAQAFEEINEEYIELMAKHVKDMGRLSATDMHRLEQMNKMDANIAHINKKLRQQCNLTVLQLDKLYKESGLSLYDDMDVFYSAKGVEQVPFEQNRRIQEYIQSVDSLTYGTFENLSRTTAMSENYRKVVDRGIYAVSSGMENYQTAIRKALVKAATDGMRVKYASGYTRRLDSAARMNILSGVRQVNLGIRQITGEQFGADGYEISAHGLCAEDHQPIQGKQFSKKEFNKLQASLARPIGTLNCQHTAYPIILGVSQPTYSDSELKDMLDYSNEKITLPNGKIVSRYEASQVMRNIETNIRYAKDSFIAGKASGDDVLMQKAKAKIKKNQEQYKKVCEASGLKPRTERMSVSGYRNMSIKVSKTVKSPVSSNRVPTIKNTLTMKDIKAMNRDTLQATAKNIFLKENVALGEEEATRRFNALINSNSDNQLQKYIQKHQANLSVAETIKEAKEHPETLKNFKAFSTERKDKWMDDIASRHIVDIDKVNSNIKNVNKHFGDFLASDDAQFCMRIDTEEVLPKIIESGKFKTQFETNTSGGALSTSLRELTSKNLFGWKDRPTDAGFEKYGYLRAGSFKDEALLGDVGVSQYGDASITFKKKNLMDRTTLTFGDSLDAGGAVGQITPTKVNDFDVRHSARRMSDWATVDKDWQKLDDNVANFTKMTNVQKNDFLMGDGISNSKISMRYTELQFHGDLTVDDIDTISIEQDMWDYLPDSSRKNIQNFVKLKNIKLEII